MTVGVIQAPSGRWKANISHNGTRVYLGVYDTENEAAEIVTNYREKHNITFKPNKHSYTTQEILEHYQKQKKANAPANSDWYIHGFYYKKGLHGFIYQYVKRWVRSTMTDKEILTHLKSKNRRCFSIHRKHRCES